MLLKYSLNSEISLANYSLSESSWDSLSESFSVSSSDERTSKSSLIRFSILVLFISYSHYSKSVWG